MKTVESRPLVLQGGKVIDGRGSEPQICDIMICGNRIKKIFPGNRSAGIAEDALFLDMSDMTILPGLIDTHTHIAMTKGDTELSGIKESVPFKTLKAFKNAEMTLEAGFTTIRDLGADNLIDLAVRDGINQNIIRGPRVLASGFRILPTGADYPLYPPQVNFSERFTMDSPDEVRKATRSLLAMGVDNSCEGRAGGIRHGNMCHNAVFEKSFLSFKCIVDILVGNDQVRGGEMFFQ